MARLLYYTARSPFARKVRIVLAEKQLSCELKDADGQQKTPEFLRLNPIGKIPVFIDEDGLVFWDSTLIVEYLDETYPEPSFYPHEQRERLRCRQGEELADSLTDQVVALRAETRKGDRSNPQVEQQIQQDIDRLMGVFEQQLAMMPYLLNDQFTAVDVAAVSGLGYYSFRFGLTWQQRYPRLAEWFERLHQRRSLASTVPHG